MDCFLVEGRSGDVVGEGCRVCAVDVQVVKRTELRRSQRVCVSVDVVITWGGATSQLASEGTKTLIVNTHGALIALRRTVQLDDLLKVRNTKTHEEVSCRVVDLGATEKGVTNVGIEFVEPAPRFWHIAFPPEDWTARSPEAKGYRPVGSSQPGKK
jgi:hypothetical protein